MGSPRRLAAFVLCLGLGSCTLVKPVAGAITGPFVLFLDLPCHGDYCCSSGEGLVCLVGLMSAVGAVSGLATGIVSDIQVLTGDARADPARNWWNPLRTNTDGEGR